MKYKQPSRRHISEFGHSALSSMYEFFKDNKGWHSYADDAKTIRVILTLVANGILEVNKFNQARFKIRKKKK